MKPRYMMYLVGVAILCTFTLVEYLNFTGFCYAQRRYFSEQELVDFAIKQVIHFSDLVTSQVHDREVYGSVEDFHKLNSNCCILHRGGHQDLEEGVWVRSFGWHISVVEIWYRLSAEPPNEFFHASVFMSACGEIKRIGGSIASTLPLAQRITEQ